MPEREKYTLNIHGEQGCLTKTGKNCTACCTSIVEIKDFKPRGQDCQHRQACTGCKIYEARPQTCQTFHCSQLIQNSLVTLFDGEVSYNLGEIEKLQKQSADNGETEQPLVDQEYKNILGLLAYTPE